MSLGLNRLQSSLLIGLGLILTSRPCLGRDYIFQNPDTESSSSVQIQNKTKEVQPVWVLFYQEEFIEEQAFDIPPQSIKVLNLSEYKKPHWNYSILSKNLLVKPVANESNWDWSPTTRYEVKIKSQTELQLKFFNLYVEKQKVNLTYLNSFDQVVEKKEFYTASFRQNISRVEVIPFGAQKLVIESEAPLQLSTKEAFSPAQDTARTATKDFKYFLVQSGMGGSNFIAPINDPQLIQKAREEILSPQGYIVFADIELNKNQPNRNFASPEKPYWSWSIKKVTGMAQIGADWCQAYPEMIERMLHVFLRQESVCFRGQRIIRELKPLEVQSGNLNKFPLKLRTKPEYSHFARPFPQR